MKKIIKLFSLFLVLVSFVVGCKDEAKTNNTNGLDEKVLISVSYDELNEKLENKDTFILEVVQDGCHNCTSFTPKFEKVLDEYDLVAYTLNISIIDANDSDKFLKEYNVDGTPTVIFFKDGKETSTLKRLVGNKDEDVIISKLRSNGYIE